MELSAVNGQKMTPKETKRWREGGLCICCGDSWHFAVRCPSKLKAASGQVEINPFKENKGKGKEQDDESGKV